MSHVKHIDASEQQWERLVGVLCVGNPVLHGFHQRVQKEGAKVTGKSQFGVFDLYLHMLPHCARGRGLEILGDSLTAKEVDLILDVRDVYPDAVSYLAKLCSKFAISYAKKFGNIAEKTDFLEEAYLAVYRALVSYLPKEGKEAKFITYAHQVIFNQLDRYMRNQYRQPRQSLYCSQADGGEVDFDQIKQIAAKEIEFNFEEIASIEEIIGCKFREFASNPTASKTLSRIDAYIIHSQMHGVTDVEAAKLIGYSTQFVRTRKKKLNEWLQSKLAA